VARIAREVEARYVFPEVGARMAERIRSRSATGAYDAARSRDDFARAVTDDLRDVSHDRHALFGWKPLQAQGDSEGARRVRIEEEHRRTAGFGATEQLPGGVVRLAIDSFEPDAPAVREAVTRRLSEVAGARALILDLRQNNGGDPATVALVASYLFEGAPVHLNDLFWRESGETQRFFTHADVPGARFGAKKPVFVLTSHRGRRPPGRARGPGAVARLRAGPAGADGAGDQPHHEVQLGRYRCRAGRGGGRGGRGRRGAPARPAGPRVAVRASDQWTQTAGPGPAALQVRKPMAVQSASWNLPL
jgi:hypothetical protein